MRFRIVACICALSVVFGVQRALATAVPTSAGMSVEFRGTTFNWTSLDHPEAIWGPDTSGYYHFSGNWVRPNWTCAFDFLVDPDPFISGAFTVINGAATTDEFVVTVTLPSVPVPLSSIMTGSISGSVGDNDGSGTPATITNVIGDSVYTALIDGAPVRKLLYADLSPFSVTSPGFLTAPFGPDNFIGETGPAVSTSIGIRHRFTLTGMDAANFNTTFVVVVPEPGGAALLLLGGVALLRRRNP